MVLICSKEYLTSIKWEGNNILLFGSEGFNENIQVNMRLFC